MAIAVKNSWKWEIAITEAKKTNPEPSDLEIFEEYKKLGGAFVEDTNEQIDITPKFLAIFDPEKPKKKKVAKKKPKKKKK